MIIKQGGLNGYLRIGVLLIGICIGINHFIELQDFLFGLGLGLGIALELIGAYAMKHDMSKVRGFKKRALYIFVK